MNNQSHQDDGPEWEALEGVWRGSPAPPAAPLRDRVRREQRRLRIGAACEWLLASAYLGWAAWEFATFTATGLLRGVLLVSLTAIALLLTLHARRGSWTPAAETTAAYLDISRRRLSSTRRAVAYAWLLYALELLVLAGVEYAGRAGLTELQPSKDPVFLGTFLAVFTAALATGSAWQLRRTRRERIALDALANDLGDGTG